MVDQCGGSTDPAVQFYGCIENTTQLPAVWAAMGLNATLMRLRTVDSFIFIGHNMTELEDKNTFVTMMQADTDNSSDTNNTGPSMMDLFSTIGAQSESLCGNVDGLMACLNPYLSACFPDAESDNDLAPQKQSRKKRAIAQANDEDKMSAATGDDETAVTDAPDAESSTDSDEDDDDDTMQSFFMIPYLETQSQIFPALQQAFSAACSNRAEPLKGFIDNVPCLIQSMNQGASSCQACDIPPTDDSSTDDDTNSTSSSVAQPSAGSGPDLQTCSALRDCAECQLDLVAQTCGQEVANNIQTVLQIYFNALQCFPSNSGNTVRAPFNVHVL